MSLYLQSIHQGERYLIPISEVIEVTPYVRPRLMPHVPSYLAGMIDYRGETIPLVDICYLLSNQPCKTNLCSRILIGEMKAPDGREIKMGWLFDGVTETVRIESHQFEAAPLHLKSAPYLGDVVTDDKGIMQCIVVQSILPDDAYGILFPL